MVPKICAVDGCNLNMHARGFCDRHYRQWMRSNPLQVPRQKVSVEERFWAKVNKLDSESCWEWGGGRGPYGHGHFNYEHGRGTSAHRMAYKLTYGAIPDGLVIDHICHNPPCVNPGHLRAVTHKQNIENQLGAHRTSKSGIRGVRFIPKSKRWRAELKHHGQRVSVGSFGTAEEARLAVIAARNDLFTHNDADR